MTRITAAVVPLAFPAAVGAITFTSAGRWDLPFVWSMLGALCVFYLALGMFSHRGLMEERLRPGPGSQDRLTGTLGGLMLVIQWILAGLDVGRLRWTPLAWQLQLVGLIGYALALAALFWAMRNNPFYSSAVRLQSDRGQHVVAAGPYRFMRHPGYAATLLGTITGGLLLGSWMACLPLAVFFALFVRRTLMEDRFLRENLEGYADYAQRVRYRLIPGLF